MCWCLRPDTPFISNVGATDATDYKIRYIFDKILKTSINKIKTSSLISNSFILVAHIIFITKIPFFPNPRSHPSIKIKHITTTNHSIQITNKTKTALFNKKTETPKNKTAKKKGMILMQVLKTQ